MRRLSILALCCVVATSPAAARAADAGADAGPPPDAGAVLRRTAAVLGVSTHAVPSLHVALRGKANGSDYVGDVWSDAVARTFASLQPRSVGAEDTGFDGRDAWFRDNKGVVWVQGAAGPRSAAANEAFRESYALWTPGAGGATVSLEPPRSERGHTFDVLAVSVPHGVVPFDVLIDRDSGLPVRYVERVAPVTTTTDLGDYRPVAGVLFPFAQHAATTEGNDTTAVWQTAEANPPGLAEHLAKPVSDVNDFAIDGGATSATVPFRLVDEHAYVDVMLNGKGPFHFVVDTGGLNLVDTRVARAIGATGSASMEAGGIGSGTVSSQYAVVRSLRVGAAELHDQAFVIADVDGTFAKNAGSPLDGLIGFEVLSRFVTTFDYAAETLTLALPGAPAHVGGSTVPFVFNGMQPQVACALDGIASTCDVDTGSSASLDIYAPFVTAHPDIVPRGATAMGSNGVGAGGQTSGRLGRLATLELGGFTLRDLVAGFSSDRDGAFAAEHAAANVGGSVWKRFLLTFDYGRRTMTLVPNAAFAAPDVTERAGLSLVRDGDVVRVLSVRPGTPAALAGIAAGDAIVTLDGRSVSTEPLADVRASLRRPNGTRVLLGLRPAAGGAVRDVSIVLHDYV